MTTAKILPEQWVTRFRDFFTGQVLKSFQELSGDERALFATVRDKILTSQNLASKAIENIFLTLHIW